MNSEYLPSPKRRVYRKINWYFVLTVLLMTGFFVSLGVGLYGLRKDRVLLVVRQRSVFAVVVGDFDSRSQAELAGEEARKSGAAGFVFGEDGFEVGLAVFDSRADAEIVAEGIAGASVREIVRAEQCIDAGTKIQQIWEGYVALDRACSRLIELAIQLDKHEVSQAFAVFQMRTIGEELREVGAQLESTDPLRTSLDGAADWIEQAIAVGGSVASQVRFATCGVAQSALMGDGC